MPQHKHGTKRLWRNTSHLRIGMQGKGAPRAQATKMMARDLPLNINTGISLIVHLLAVRASLMSHFRAWSSSVHTLSAGVACAHADRVRINLLISSSVVKGNSSRLDLDGPWTCRLLQVAVSKLSFADSPVGTSSAHLLARNAAMRNDAA